MYTIILALSFSLKMKSHFKDHNIQTITFPKGKIQKNNKDIELNQ